MIRPTEARNPRTTNLDRLSAPQIVALMDEEEHAAFVAVTAVTEQLALVAERMAAAYRAGGRIFYLGAGTSGRLAVMDAAEIPPTFGAPPDRFVAFIASGPSGGPAAITATEDDVEAIEARFAAEGVGSGDVVVGLAASGSTPFVVRGLAWARAHGAYCCGIANNPDTPLLIVGDIGILLDTGPEVITGSTRLKAGTAQKLVLNRLSTTAMVLVGAVMSNLMVELRPANAKMRARCVSIVADLTDGDVTAAEALLEAADWSIRDAVDRATPG